MPGAVAGCDGGLLGAAGWQAVGVVSRVRCGRPRSGIRGVLAGVGRMCWWWWLDCLVVVLAEGGSGGGASVFGGGCS